MLDVEEFVVAELGGPRRELVKASGLRWHWGVVGREQVDEAVDVVGPWVLDGTIGEDGLEKLLDSLLGVEADRLIGDVAVVGQLVDYDLVGSCLAQEQPRVV